MSGIDVGVKGRRSMDHSLPLVPFIDFLLCLISFLLITAVWSQMARINADARVPSTSTAPREQPNERTLHVEMKSNALGFGFKLAWKHGGQVLDTRDVPLDVQSNSAAMIAYPKLAEAIAVAWSTNPARHFATTDAQLDQIVLHTDNGTPFEHVVAVIDAANQTQRPWRSPTGQEVQRPALNLTFAVN
jgi:biopolymer transport protein ExbD